MDESERGSNHRTQATNVVTSQSSDNMSLVSTEKFAQHQKSLMGSTSVNAFSESDKICLITPSSKWVIDSGATNHMTGNPNIFSSFL